MIRLTLAAAALCALNWWLSPLTVWALARLIYGPQW
jgi:hypothetical protein